MVYIRIKMRSGKENEMLFALSILKNPEVEYNSNSLAKQLHLSPMGSLKVANRLQKDGILIYRKVGKAKIYKISNSEYALQYIKLMLKKEAEISHHYIKRWIEEIKKANSAKAAILFGSALKKHEGSKDIDVLFIVDNKNFAKLKKEIEEINLLNTKKIHPIFQNEEDLEKNIGKKDPVILNAIKGVVVFGEDALLKYLIK